MVKKDDKQPSVKSQPTEDAKKKAADQKITAPAQISTKDKPVTKVETKDNLNIKKDQKP